MNISLADMPPWIRIISPYFEPRGTANGGNKTPVIYYSRELKLTKGDEVIIGHAAVIADKIGASKSYITNCIAKHTKVRGWTIELTGYMIALNRVNDSTERITQAERDARRKG